MLCCWPFPSALRRPAGSGGLYKVHNYTISLAPCLNARSRVSRTPRSKKATTPRPRNWQKSWRGLGTKPKTTAGILRCFKQVDKAMDDFITPLGNYTKAPPDAAKVKAAYNRYLEKLNLAD
jgi:hypothetical protein